MKLRQLLVLVLVLVSSSGVQRASGIGGSAVDRCPAGLPGTSAVRAFRNTCYQFVSYERYWTAARDYCIQVLQTPCCPAGQ